MRPAICSGGRPVPPGDRDHRDADVGKDVGGRAQRSERSHDEQQHREHHEGVRTLERNLTILHQHL
jgi:hypothetical protein